MSAAVGGSNSADGTGTGRVVVLRARVNGPDCAGDAGVTGAPEREARKLVLGIVGFVAGGGGAEIGVDSGPVAGGASVGAWGSPAPRTARALASRLAKTPDGRRTAIPPPLGCATAATPACSSRVFSARIFSSVGWVSGVSLSNRTPIPGVTFSRVGSFSRIQTTVPSPARSGVES